MKIADRDSFLLIISTDRSRYEKKEGLSIECISGKTVIRDSKGGD